jgi:hypothetical protein
MKANKVGKKAKTKAKIKTKDLKTETFKKMYMQACVRK